MTKILAFPTLRPPPTNAGSVFFNEEEIQAYVLRNAADHPERVDDLKLKMELAIKAAGVLHELMETIRFDLDLAEVQGR
jgi:hypothetical protein